MKADNLVVATSKVRRALEAAKLPEDVKQQINVSDAATVSIDLTTAPIPFLRALLDLDLTERQRKMLYLVVSGVENPNELLTTVIDNPREFHNALVALRANKDSPNCEIVINGRWYPVVMDSSFQSNDMYGDRTFLSITVQICDQVHDIRHNVSEMSFVDDNGNKTSMSVKRIMDLMGIRPVQTDLQEHLRINRVAERQSAQAGLMLAATGPAIFINMHRWGSNVDPGAFASPTFPRKVVIEPTLESNPSSKSYHSGQVTRLPFVRVFSFDLKKYIYVDVRDVETYVFDTHAVTRLVLPENVNTLVTSIFASDTTKMFGDLVNGKHGGVVIMASGDTGVGKTLTAEAFAEHTKRPLYVLEMGELGTSLADVEKNLQAVFSRAARWNAILLMDEADVFMAKRDASLERSAIVGVFLRLLDYYPGLLFLTTNRPDVIDPAFKSRISLHLKYPNLDTTARTKIWVTMLAAAKINVDGGLGGVPAISMNGRNIRNAVRILKILHPGVKNPDGVEGWSTVGAAAIEAVCTFTPQ